MIIFKKILNDDLKIYYKFSGAGFQGQIEFYPDSDSLYLKTSDTLNKHEKEKLLYIFRTRIAVKNYPDKYTYAYC